MREQAVETAFENSIKQTLPQEFPDIIAKKYQALK